MRFHVYNNCFGLITLLTTVIQVLATPVSAQFLNQDCIINILNRTVQVATDGGWSMPNVPSTMGQVRARATCTRDGKTTSGQTDFFSVVRNGVTQTGSFQFGSLEPPPSSLAFDPSDAIQINGTQTTLVLKVIATYPDSSSRDVTVSNSGINYTSTNLGIASVDADGLVTGQSSGNALIIARLDGTLAVLQLSVLTSGDSDGDGLPDDYEISKGLNPNDPVDAQEDQDNDGLSALSEFNAGTEPSISDTDGDNILDGEELVVGTDGFVTSPLLFDTDGDGIGDGLEIATGSDPTDASSFNLAGTLSSIQVTPPVFTLIFNTVFSEASRQLTVTGTLSDGNTLDLTSSVKGTTYTTSDISICSFGADSGRIFAGVDGACTVTVSNSGFSSTTNIVVQTFTPTPLSFMPIPGIANNVDVNGDFAHVAAGSSGLQIVNVADRSAPTMAGSVDTPGNANDVKVVGGTAFVADGISGLQIIDVADPSAPSIIGVINTPGDAQDVLVKGNLAYVADGSAGLQIIDLINRNIIGSVDTPGSAFGVAVDTTIAVIADRAGGVQVVDISDSTNPMIVGSVDTGDAWDVALSEFNDFVFVADLASSFTAVEITDPTNPIIQARTNPSLGGLLKDVTLNNELAFGADFFFVNGVPVIDVATPGNPIPRVILNFSGFRDDDGTGIATDSSFVYLTAAKGSDSRLYIGQYLALQDFGGIPPTVTINAPEPNITVIEGASLLINVEATDDISVAAVNFLANDTLLFTDTAAPYEFNLMVPMGETELSIGATATDLGGNTGIAQEVQVLVIPDPLTTVVGMVIDENIAPVAGATISTISELFSSTTTFDGTFSITDVPTVRGNISVNAMATINNNEVSGNSQAIPPVSGGVTDVGRIEVREFNAGSALRFDGVNDLVTFGSMTALFENTIEAWIKPESANLGVVAGQLAGPGQACTFGAFLMGNTTLIRYDVNPAGCGNDNSISFDVDISGVWIHVAGTFDGNTERLYLNGVLVNERPNVSFAPSNWATAGAITFFNGQQFFFEGEIDEIRFWNVARTKQEIQNTMNRSLTGTELGLVGYWRFDDGEGQSVNDSSVNNITGVLGTTSAVQTNDPIWVNSEAPIR